ncbi:hypothetical protein B0J13DRAFT_584284 [Dactylonectria estremocensis]|uniref:ATPase AAA-type core domain-containing protein n=1 Tax=Dactylonectria estremocensis TaxID=1079267 RepID=A0A9P9EWE6_9HYPO|nr:hypothetical protein B0J13DRAFT_584284 [Dactylonectria estremocensis]
MATLNTAALALRAPTLYMHTSDGSAVLDDKDTYVESKKPQPSLASTLAYKCVEEAWNEKTYQYEITELAKQLGELGELNGYIFIPQNMLFNVLPELKLYQQNLTPDSRTSSHLNELINFIERTYTDTNCHIQSLLAHGEITYDLLWSLFKPNQLLFTTCSGIHKSRCVRHVCGEEKKNMYGAKYWSLDCRYNDFDGKEFGEVSIEYHPHFNEIKSELTDCGKRFVSLRGAHYRHCKGAAFFLRKGEPVELQVDSRVMIDAAFFKKANPTYPGLKINVEFAVADIEKIDWSTDAADCWIAAEEEKTVLLALAEAHLIKEPDYGFDDFIKGKGRGLNILLHGPPGVGKTLTAEVLAEYLKCPLYSVTDVYLEQRSSRDLGRNSLVSVFLCKMEFCEAIVFLITNRVMQFDEAILSRVHLAMKYGDLDCGCRKLIWKNFLDRVDNPYGKVDISDKELNELIRIELNGRQVWLPTRYEVDFTK